ncbi:MAG: GH3 auxin-responsive promoter family protein [Muribaculaceae bacterium]|nr:GH3 auxin-responsive promoter family protein [Muribaculaceae bacterium]
MIDFTPLMRKSMRNRLEEQVRYKEHADSVQQEQLVSLIEHAALTEFGRHYDFSAVRTYRQFADTVPLHHYEDLRGQIMRMVRGEADVLWRGVTRNFAQSSGTSGGKSKYIPITADSFRLNHYRGSADVVAHYLNLNPRSRIMSGKGLILGGSFANELDLKPGVRVGDLSANLIDNINPVVNLFRVPSKKIALMEDWKQKLPAIIRASAAENVTNLSGVPSWFLAVLRGVMEYRGVECIHDVWPNLEVFFHGGIAFEPYRKQYESFCDMSKMHFLDTYNASEGFFAVQSDWSTTAMLLLLDVGIFYEFIPVENSGDESPVALPAWEVETGRTYELVITACNGLWRYRIGDTVKVQSVKPLKITIAGRTQSFINAFGEELMVHNAEYAVEHAAAATGASVLNYTAAPVFAADGRKAHHQWIFEFEREPADMAVFVRVLDEKLKQVNSDYEAKRGGDIFLDAPQVVVARRGVFDDWLAKTGKLGGQRKVPRLANNRLIADAILELNAV